MPPDARYGCALLLLLCAAPPTFAADRPRLGNVHFPTSCKTSVQARFDTAVALLHSFEFNEAESTFRRVEVEDPKCAIAGWGVAIATTERSGANAPQKDLDKGWAELQPWLNVKAGSRREQMYLDAVRAMYENHKVISGTVRWQKYLRKMEELREHYPEDINASLFYGLGLTFTAGSGRDGLEQRRKALAIFLPIFEKHPNNPGVAHYIIHAADTPELAAEAVPAARKYASIAPDSPHALHMPSHIFNRLGYWTESITTNRASAHVAAEWINSGRDASFDQFHALNNVEYAYLQLGDDVQAKQVLEQITELAKNSSDPWLSIDARIYYDLETHDWNDGAKIEPPATSHFEENFDAYWIQTIAAAYLGDSSRAKRSLEQYRESQAAWSKEHGWGEILGVALTEAEAWTSFSEGERDQAVAHLKAIAQFERDHPMYYADILPRPTGEMLGDMLLKMGKPVEALEAYQQSLELAPNRFNSLVGAEKAAALMRNTGLSKDFSRRLHADGAKLARRP